MAQASAQALMNDSTGLVRGFLEIGCARPHPTPSLTPPPSTRSVKTTARTGRAGPVEASAS